MTSMKTMLFFMMSLLSTQISSAQYANLTVDDGSYNNRRLLTNQDSQGSPNITYTYNPFTCQAPYACFANLPTNTGGPITSWSCTPSLPQGLLFQTGNGVITGTPYFFQYPTNYTIVATGPGGTSTYILTIIINQVGMSPYVASPSPVPSAIPSPVPSPNPSPIPSPSPVPSPITPNITYTYNPFVCTATVAAFANTPTLLPSLSAQIQGPTNWVSNPVLPQGLYMTPSTGIITGIPYYTNPTTNFTITVTGSNGNSASTLLQITVLALPSGPIIDTPTPTPTPTPAPLSWHWSTTIANNCDTVCQAIGLSCNQAKLNSITSTSQLQTIIASVTPATYQCTAGYYVYPPNSTPQLPFFPLFEPSSNRCWYSASGNTCSASGVQGTYQASRLCACN